MTFWYKKKNILIIGAKTWDEETFWTVFDDR